MISSKPLNLLTGCTHTELGHAYAPTDTPDAARRLLMRWIKHHPTLLDRLQETGYKPHSCRRLTPMQVQMIFDALGTPC